jgi:hypothetical protein
MPCPPHSPWFGLPNIWGWLQNMKLLTVQLLSFSCYFPDWEVAANILHKQPQSQQGVALQLGDWAGG